MMGGLGYVHEELGSILIVVMRNARKTCSLTHSFEHTFLYWLKFTKNDKILWVLYYI